MVGCLWSNGRRRLEHARRELPKLKGKAVKPLLYSIGCEISGHAATE
jgi:hypothetical protein